nr:hypothetical protein [Microbacterium immunditiarum]
MPYGGSHSAPVRSPDRVPGQTEVLFVCRANQCRSPYAEAIATRLANGRPIRFHSGGLLSGGMPMPETGRRLGAALGYSFGEHRSRELDLLDLDGFDVILTAAREQAREIVGANPDLWPRVFTVKQFSRWLDDQRRPPRAIVGSWLDAVAADRDRRSLLGDDPADDVADPLGLPEPAWTAMVDELKTHLARIIDGLSPRRSDQS